MEPLTLPVELNIYAVAALRPAWLEWLETVSAAGADGADVLAADVAEVDGAGLQMLLSLHRSMGERRLRMRLHEPSPALRAACEGLGLDSGLGGGA